MAAVGAPPPAGVLLTPSVKVGLVWLADSSSPTSFSPPRTSPSFTSSSISISSVFALPLSLSLSVARRTPPRALAVSEGEDRMAMALEEAEQNAENGLAAGGARSSEEFRARVRSCKLYICNLPRSCDISQLLDIFKPFGTVYSVEVSRDAQTGVSRGSGYLTMSSVQEARAAITALDKSDLGGREMRVKISADMGTGRRNKMTSKKDMVFESPHKVYVGNLAWSVTPEILREYFSQFGTVVSARLVYDRKSGRNRVYGFLSFSSYDEVKAALETNESMLHERILLVRKVFNSEEL